MTLQAGSCWGAVGSTRVTRAQGFELQSEWFFQPTREVAGWCTPGGHLGNSDALGLENGFLLERVALHGQQVVDTLRNALQVTRWTSCYGCDCHTRPCGVPLWEWKAQGLCPVPSSLIQIVSLCQRLPEIFSLDFKIILSSFREVHVVGPLLLFTPTCVSTLEQDSCQRGQSPGHQKGTTPNHFCPWVCRMTPFPMSGAYHPVWLQELP